MRILIRTCPGLNADVVAEHIGGSIPATHGDRARGSSRHIPAHNHTAISKPVVIQTVAVGVTKNGRHVHDSAILLSGGRSRREPGAPIPTSHDVEISPPITLKLDIVDHVDIAGSQEGKGSVGGRGSVGDEILTNPDIPVASSCVGGVRVDHHVCACIQGVHHGIPFRNRIQIKIRRVQEQKPARTQVHITREFQGLLPGDLSKATRTTQGAFGGDGPFEVRVHIRPNDDCSSIAFDNRIRTDQSFGGHGRVGRIANAGVVALEFTSNANRATTCRAVRIQDAAVNGDFSAENLDFPTATRSTNGLDIGTGSDRS